MVGEKTSRSLPSAASSPIRTASATSQLRNVTPAAGRASCGWWVSANTGPRHAPPWIAPGPGVGVPAVPASQNGAGGLRVLLDDPGAGHEPGHPVHRVPRSRHEPVQRHGEVQEHPAPGRLRFRSGQW